MSYIDTSYLTHHNILSLFVDRDQIELSPDYQRHGEIWSTEKKQLLIDSIINRYDIPKLYFHKLDRKQARMEGKKFAVIDGRQRLEAIFGFMNGEYALSEDFLFLEDPKIDARGMNASELSKKHLKLKQRFDAFTLPIVCVETDDMELIEDMFSRLNEAVPLNAAEKRNAIGGDMAKAITAVSKHHFFQRKVTFSDRRYQHREGAARLLFLEKCSQDEKLIDTKKPFLDQFVRDYRNKRTTEVSALKKAVLSVLNEMSDVFVDDDDLLQAQATIPIYFLLFRAAVANDKTQKISRQKLLDFQNSRKENRVAAEKNITKANFDLLEYDRLSQQGTNDASSIRERLAILRKHCGI